MIEEKGSVPAQTILELRQLSKHFGGIQALRGVDFDLRAGEVHGIIGENGAGKSTLMKILSGVYSDYEGEMILHGQSVRFHSPADARVRGIGMVHQELTVFPDLTIAENLFNGTQPTTRLGRVDWRTMRRQAREHLRELGITIDGNRLMRSVSVGTQQMIEIARVIFSGAGIIILDEPTSSLSLAETQRLFEFIRRLREQGKTIIFISHFLEDVLQVADRVSIFKNGERVTTREASSLTKHEMVSLMLGSESQLLQATDEEVTAAHRLATPRGEKVVLSVQGFSYHHTFQDVSFTLHEGEMLGLYGFVGAGQLELAHCLFGALHPTAGHIQLYGKEVKIRSTYQAKKLGIAYVSENRHDSLVLDQEVFKNITLAHLSKVVPLFLRQAPEIAVARAQLEATRTRPSDPFLPVSALSGGNQQKVVVAKWLLNQPRVLIVAEPTRGMDVGAKEDVLNLIHQQRARGVAVLLISTEIETILANCTRAFVMRKGRIMAELQGEQLSREQLLFHAQ